MKPRAFPILLVADRCDRCVLASRAVTLTYLCIAATEYKLPIHCADFFFLARIESAMKCCLNAEESLL